MERTLPFPSIFERRNRDAKKRISQNVCLPLYEAKLLQHLLSGRAIACGLADVLVPYDSLFVDDKGGGSGETIASQVVDFVIAHHVGIRVIQHWKWDADSLGHVLSLGQVIGAYRHDLCIEVSYLVVLLCQLNELGAAVGSPESSVEHDHDVLIPKLSVE